MAEEQGSDERTITEYEVAEIQKAADRAAELTKQLLAFSRRQMVQPAPLDLNNLVEDLLPMLRRLVGDRIVINDEPSSMMPAIMASIQKRIVTCVSDQPSISKW